MSWERVRDLRAMDRITAEEAYRAQVMRHLIKLFHESVTSDEWAAQMDEIETLAEGAGYLSLSPSRASPDAFSEELFSDLGMKTLVRWDMEFKHALSAEWPNELMSNLLPSDGHLD